MSAAAMCTLEEAMTAKHGAEKPAMPPPSELCPMCLKQEAAGVGCRLQVLPG